MWIIPLAPNRVSRIQDLLLCFRTPKLTLLNNETICESEHSRKAQREIGKRLESWDGELGSVVVVVMRSIDHQVSPSAEPRIMMRGY